MFLIDFFKGVGKVFKAIGKAFLKVFSSKEAQAVFQLIVEKILPEAKPIVEAIRASIASPTDATVEEIIDLYRQMGRVVTDIADNPTAKANALLNLATEILSDVFPQYSTPLLHSAIELALSGIKAEEG